MLPHRSLSATAATFFFLLAGIAVAHADPASGAWKLTAGKADACTLTLADDHTATGCTGVAKWKPTPSGLTLYAGNGTVYGIVATKGDAYTGKTFGYEQTLTLSRDTLASR